MFTTASAISRSICLATLLWLIGAAIPDAPVSAAEGLKHDVPYRAYEGSSRRIIIQVTLNDRTEAVLAVDTGAPGTIISTALAKRLGLLDDDTAKLWTTAGGIGGTTPAIYTVIDKIKIGDVEQQFFLTTVVPSMSSAFEGLIGMDFLSAFNTSVDPKRRIFSLQEIQHDSEFYGGKDETWWRANFQILSALSHAWKNYADQLQRKADNSIISAGSGIEDMKKVLAFSKQQAEEAQHLFDRLDRYAIQNQVPMQWREY